MTTALPTYTNMYQDANGLWIKTTDYYPPTPADGDDMTWDESTLSRDTALLSESALAKVWADDDDELENDGYLALFIEVRAQKLMIDRLQNEMHGLAAQVVELRERDNFFDGVLKGMSDTIQNMPNANRGNLLAQIADLREKVQAWEGDS